MRIIFLLFQLITAANAGELIPTLVPVNGGYDIVPADSRKKEDSGFKEETQKPEKDSYWIRKNETRDGYTIELK